MRNFIRRFGFENILLSEEEKIELDRRLWIQDQKRIGFFALISSFSSFIFIIFDIFNLYGSNQEYYFIADIIFLVTSVAVIVFSILKSKTQLFQHTYDFLTTIYPFACIIWATSVATLNSTGMLNMLTFYLTFYLVSLFLTPKPKFYALYFVTFLTVYFTIYTLLYKPVFNETLLALCSGSILTIPFYSSFRATRRNSIFSLLKLNQSNRNLKKKVIHQKEELKERTNYLNNEIAIRNVIENKLGEALKRAELSDQLKAEFLDNISHEIRTPINSILGFNELLTKENISDQERQLFHEQLSSNTMFLLSIFDNIFDASLINTKQINLVESTFEVNQLLESIIQESHGMALKYNKNEVELLIRRLPDDKTTLNTDEFLLKKALVRLVDNAYKYTPRGKIELGAYLYDTRLDFVVSDTGVGIKNDEMKKVFEPFVRGDDSYSKSYSGVGLGLSIVKGIVDELSCEMKIDSNKNSGTSITLTFESSKVESNQPKVFN